MAEAWGAQGGSSATLSTATATSVDSTSLDVASVMKATLAISGEVKPARLVLMQTIIENVGRSTAIDRAWPR
jgi:hypothetical protein